MRDASGANQTQAWAFTTAPLADGVHNFTVTSTDAAGNVSAAATLNVTIDTVAPNAPVITGNSIVNANQLQLTGTAEAGSTVKLFDGSTVLGTATANASGAWSYTTAALSGGTHAVTATATDVAGNTGVASLAVNALIGGNVIEFGNETTSLTLVGKNFYLYDSAGNGPALKYGGALVVPGQFGGFTPIGAEKTATGYQVVWKLTGGDQYSTWNTDSSGNYVSTGLYHVSGASSALQSMETVFNQDLNGDGTIGLAPVQTTVVETNGATSLNMVGSNFYLCDGAGNDPALKCGGALVVPGQFGSFTPIGAEKTATGYQVVWKLTGGDQYSTWNTDSSGNYVSIGPHHVSGASSALQSMETVFNQDLNGDGTIGSWHQSKRRLSRRTGQPASTWLARTTTFMTSPETVLR